MPAVALVTGGNRGIGLGITQRLLADGFAVSILATREEPTELLESLDAPGRVRYVRGSVADLEDHARFVDDAVEAWGRLDLLVNNAGVAPSVRADLLEAGPESFDRVLGINLRGPYFLTQTFANRVIALGSSVEDRPRATVINVSSISATAVSTNRGDYCVSKAGVAMATQLFAVRLAPEGIVVYEVRPGASNDSSSSVGSSRVARIETAKPSARSRCVIPRPIPRLPPVTSATAGIVALPPCAGRG